MSTDITVYNQPPPWQPAVVISDIEVDAYWVRTPVGVIRSVEAQWSVRDGVRIERYTSGWIILLVLITVWFFLLGLLFLLIKSERRIYQTFVTVTGNGLTYTACIEATDGVTMSRDVRARVAYAHSITAR